MDLPAIYEIQNDAKQTTLDMIRAGRIQFPDRPRKEIKQVYVNLMEMKDNLQEIIIEYPEYAIPEMEEAIREELGVHTNVRIRYLPDQCLRQVRDLRSIDISKLRSIQGIVTRVSEVRPKALVGVFRCTGCGFKQEILQDTFNFTEPLECPKDDGGCGKRSGSTNFRFIVSESLLIDRQVVEIQDIPELITGRAQPQKRHCILEDDLVETLEAGDRVHVIAEVKAKQRRGSRGMKSDFDTYLFAHGVETVTIEEDLSQTDEELEEMREVSEGTPVVEISRSIAPSIKGVDDIKMALALATTGAPRRIRADGSVRRGDIHLLIAGDPSTGKSDLLEYIQLIHPRAVFGSGRSSSGPGLTAAVVKDEFGDGRYTIEAGMVVQADGGLALIDELEKMKSEDRSSLHEAMEKQTVTITKVIRSTLRARTGIIAAANPKDSLFKQDGTSPLSPQIDLDPTLQSRFSIIYCLMDVPDSDRDHEIAMHNLDYTHNMDAAENTRSPVWIRKYIHMARQIEPEIPKELRDKIAGEYARMRSPKDLSIREDRSITIRQLEDVQRLCEASARLRWSREVNEYDVQLAFELLRKSLTQVTAGEDGTIDITTMYSGVSKSKRAIIGETMQLLEDMGARTEMIPQKEVLEVMQENFHLEEYDARATLGILYKKGKLYYPRGEEKGVMII